MNSDTQRKEPRPVVAAAIVDSLDHPTKLLCAARAYPNQLRGQFELPGGKVEIGESPTRALHREIQEELATQLTLGTEIPHPMGAWPILEGRTMRVWFAQIAVGAPMPTAGSSHIQLVWQPINDLDVLPWLATNKPIVTALQEQVFFAKRILMPLQESKQVEHG